MFCTRCGSKLDPSSRFCSSCGAPINGGATSSVPPPFAVDRLVRPRNNRMIAGVCAAFALRYGWDVTVVRIIAALICLSGAGALAYLVAWIIIPEEPYAIPSNPV
ncbi:PspC domain-containing protein [Edaphobacter albus]|uniref:PspC domain-containing protein n=1 Tax=Edaphobacter sp. 4G125 TaxID=2763071 RepID=UPI00164748D0|nr:PspC domain-containing protein [Edaphobacter sp. 4G125]QNI35441.1 PspC domain-containing protein [Edaphobacter sp. 4G125]